MLNILLATILLVASSATAFTQESDLWNVFEEVEFKSEFIEEEGTYVLKPVFTDEVKNLDGKEVEVLGYYIPVSMKEDVIILSRTNYTSCYFCGGGGPETVIEVEPLNRFQKLKTDDKIRVKGILSLNSDNIYRLNFILKEATIISD